jgi:hypothetical protein
MECLICFCEENNLVNCGKPNCEFVFCFDCSERLIEFSAKEKVIPSCSCGEPLHDSQVEKMPKKFVNIYRDCLYNCLYNSSKDIIEHRRNSELIISKLQADRLRYIETFPACVSLVIKCISSSRKNNVKKNYLDKINSIKKKCSDVFCRGYIKVDICITCNLIHCKDCKKVKEQGHSCNYSAFKSKKCSDVFCIGVLDNENVCIICETVYCYDCEEAKSNGHICDKGLLDSINLLKTMVKCPKCEIPAIKSEGCNNMTCPICKTNFCYRTGKIVIPGNHSDLTIKLVEYNALELIREGSRDYGQDIIEVMEKIFEIKNKKGTNLADVLKKMENKGVNIGPIYEKYRNCHNRNERCSEALKSISKKISDLDIDFMNERLIYIEQVNN